MDYLPLYNKMQAGVIWLSLVLLAGPGSPKPLSWDEKFKLDVWYVDHRSLALDLESFNLHDYTYTW